MYGEYDCLDMEAAMDVEAYRKARIAFVENALKGQVICGRCSATLGTFADACTAGLADACPGFIEIEAAKQRFDALLQREAGNG